MHDKNFTPSGSEHLQAINGALECLAWSETDESGEPLDSFGAYFSEDAKRVIGDDVRAFMADNSEDLDGLNYSQIGHDFILTRNGHGAGFWDRGLGERGERLTDACKSYGSINAYLSDSNSDIIEVQ